MNRARFDEIAANYSDLRIAVLGDFCLDRYLEIDPRKQEVSIETDLEVHNVTNVRAQPGAAGTILNNLVALGVGELIPIGFCGDDGEGWLLMRELAAMAGVNLAHFQQTDLRKTFTYTKPLVLEPGEPPRELNRLDQKNWTETPIDLAQKFNDSIAQIAKSMDAIIVMDQVDLPNTGVITSATLETLRNTATQNPDLLIVADSRQGLERYPPVTFKMNRDELARLVRAGGGGRSGDQTSEVGGQNSEGDGIKSIEAVKDQARLLAKRNENTVIVTLSERGIIAATPDGEIHDVPCLPIKGEIDIVGAGDNVTANLTAALAAGAKIPEALELSMISASVVIHKLGTTGTATLQEIGELQEEMGDRVFGPVLK